MLVGKRGILGELSFSLQTNARLIVLSIKLHNFVLDRTNAKIIRTLLGDS